jgi:hypothetical protein
VLHSDDMRFEVARASDAPTPVLLIEANPDARSRHENALRDAGYAVSARSACPDADECRVAAIVLSDVPSYHWLQEQHIGTLPPTVVLTTDEKAGITACLCGADAWVPTDSDDGYLLDTVSGLLRYPGSDSA